VVAATVLGSGTVFLEMTVVNVALPSMARDLNLGIAGLQWILDGYLLTLSALILLGGALGDVYGRGRVFTIGLVGFYVTAILPALIVFGIGLGVLVAPLTAAALAAAPDELKGVASAFNNAVARVAGLLAVALLPLAAGMAGAKTIEGAGLVGGFVRAMYISAGLCFAGAVIAYLTMGARED
jgi:MFS family permease